MKTVRVSELNRDEKILLSKDNSFSLPYVAPNNQLIDEWPCFVIECKNENIAYASLEKHLGFSDILWIQNLCVKSEEQRKGYGKKLVNYILNFAEINNYQKVNLYAHKEYTFEFWKSLGFRKVGNSGESMLFEKNI